MKKAFRSLTFTLVARLATTWPTSVYFDMLTPYMNAWHNNWFIKPDADAMMQIVFGSQSAEPKAPSIEIPEQMIEAPHFIQQLFTYAELDGLCVEVDYPKNGSGYRFCLLPEGHSQPHFTFEWA